MENFILNSEFFDQSVVRIPEDNLDTSKLNGGNQKKIFIVCQLQDENQSIDEDFLKKIFESVQLDINRDTIILLLPQNKDFSWNSMTKAIDFKTLIFFGNDLKRIGLQLAATPYIPFEFQERRLLLTEPLEIIAADRTKKAALWNGLKAMFDIA